ncbi:50S ribosomal protein L25/general stress protein Ctc [Methyloceanibacter methanicus]|uniref:Large ribosomal subunit protein bL25 n=1 Tax=Methyloceanibacter methanicus TaxID=1774968 RepID=A0A1E3W304_9HYPH|nr:50S ribosomal protein L25/general stress protein Ctc [Methyloceanibacter methanicus]ODS00176.1 50S ribosomal protein L25/general stress protein Ctc [Methyloceanibacter methanicus]
MAEAIELKAWTRGRTGTGGARAVRREGRIPGIIYGGNDEPLNIALETKEVSKQIQTGHFQSTVYMIDMDGTKIRAIPRDVQVDPVRDFPIHVDFLRLAKNASVDVDVPVHFLNEAASPGLKRGGILNVVRHEITLVCPADRIPDSIEIDLTGMEIGDSIHISSVSLPEGAVPSITDRDFTIATIAGRGADEATEEAAEGEGEGAAEAAEESKE